MDYVSLAFLFADFNFFEWIYVLDTIVISKIECIVLSYHGKMLGWSKLR